MILNRFLITGSNVLVYTDILKVNQKKLQTKIKEIHS